MSEAGALPEPSLGYRWIKANVYRALGFAVFAWLSGGVLSRKLPVFPMQTWILLHVAAGFALGVLISPAATIPEELDPEPLEIELIALVTVAAMVVGAVLGALFGSLQALVLRTAARGLGTWIGFSALAGTALAIVVLATYLGPDAGLMKEVVGQAAAFMMQVVAAMILLPAVRRLQPREPASSAPDAPPPP